LIEDNNQLCPFTTVIELLQRKWVLLILRELYSGKMRFNQLQARVKGINPRSLSKRLSELEAEGLVCRTVITAIPPWVEYELTDKGRDLCQILKTLHQWGVKWSSPKNGVG
jgi:DNA-binding HxlR family transcriptional regulator